MGLAWATILATINYLLGLLAPAYVFIPIPILPIVIACLSLAITTSTGAAMLWGGAHDLQGSTYAAYTVAYVTAFILGVIALLVAHILYKKRSEDGQRGALQRAKGTCYVLVVLIYLACAAYPAAAFWVDGGNLKEAKPVTLPDDIASSAVKYTSVAAAQHAALAIFALLAFPCIFGCTEPGEIISSWGPELIIMSIILSQVGGFITSVYFTSTMLAQVVELKRSGEGTGAEGEIVAHLLSVVGTATIVFYSVICKE